MIRNEKEYQEARKRLKDEKERMDRQRKELHKMGLSAEEIKRATDPMLSFHLQLLEEVQNYERLKRGELGELNNLHGLGRMLVALRIAKGLSQRKLAEILNVSESQVSRDERNEYHGITIERANKILDALGANLESRFLYPLFSGTDDDQSDSEAATG